uniref:Uncharacterized protein n=1 Tax=Kalanchoe fedtschenkoi TaxID=63787 RepID=A0A7N0TVT2_KALFE
METQFTGMRKLNGRLIFITKKTAYLNGQQCLFASNRLAFCSLPPLNPVSFHSPRISIHSFSIQLGNETEF